MASVSHFLQDRLRLRVNEAKSAVGRPWTRKFLGFSFYKNRGTKVRLAPKSLELVKEKIRELTDRNRAQSMAQRIKTLNAYLSACRNASPSSSPPARKVRANGGGPMSRALDNAYWRAQGLVGLAERYQKLRQAWRTAGCGPACPVV